MSALFEMLSELLLGLKTLLVLAPQNFYFFLQGRFSHMAKQNITPTWKQAYASAAGLPYQLIAAIQGMAYRATAYAVKRPLLSSMPKV